MLDISWLFGHAKTNFIHHPNTITLTANSGTKTSLADLVKEVTPPCRLNPLLANGHLQTFWTATKEAGPPIHYKRKVFESTHSVYPGHFAVDIVVPSGSPEDKTLPERTTYISDEEFDNIGSEDTTPVLICLHGLTGGSHEAYLRYVIARVAPAGWEALVVNSRGCAMSKITTPHLFNSRATWDLRQTVKWLRITFPNRPLYAVGFSLGANILTNYLGEEGIDCELKAAAVVSNPWNLELCHHAIMRTYLGREVYSVAMGKNMMRLYESQKDVLIQHPHVDAEKVKACKYLYEFDRVVQAPTWGYPTESAYHRDSSCVDALTAVRIPFLGLNAEDDPISTYEAIPWEEFKANPYTVLVTTNWGGHLSWFQTGGDRWFAAPVADFFHKMQDDIDLTASATELVNANGKKEDARKHPVWDPTHRRLIVPLT
ncbi:AB-hydrolase YheT [Amniculicola lignicola CBS 123094]|uniref:alcohol O-acetyltransferase n=1 Tax=Amniculicola lignicola CBS 123094 TaxID=1392246 RepID=A0A6A5X0L5_9PLEO|nr:AB-hydrolase YheT [Amniculicola lignicola CBS 123094]